MNYMYVQTCGNEAHMQFEVMTGYWCQRFNNKTVFTLQTTCVNILTS